MFTKKNPWIGYSFQAYLARDVNSPTRDIVKWSSEAPGQSSASVMGMTALAKVNKDVELHTHRVASVHSQCLRLV